MVSTPMLAADAATEAHQVADGPAVVCHEGGGEPRVGPWGHAAWAMKIPDDARPVVCARARRFGILYDTLQAALAARQAPVKRADTVGQPPSKCEESFFLGKFPQLFLPAKEAW